jgi:Icc-related predicted phosphoesterase
LLRRADAYDAVVLSGDALSITAHVPVEAQIVAVRTTLAEIARRTRLVLCSGNHDLDALNGAREKTARWVAELDLEGIVVDGRTVAVEGALLTVLPWWDGPAARAEVDALLEETAARRDRPWVWAYHSPPECRLSWTGSRHYGDEAARIWIDRHAPDVVLCGHIHQAPFTPEGSWIDRIGSTWLFNPGKQMGNVPCCVDLDLTAGTAAWISTMGIEERRLDPTPAADGQ